MHTYRYLIVGGGLTADAACKGIRERDPDGTIGLVADEAYPPYARPPLTKALWKGDDEDTIWCGTADLGVDLRRSRTIVALDVPAQQATDDAGETYSYERLLLATGGRPRRLPFGGDEVIYFRTVDDYRRLRALADDHARFLVIGGGFIGSEIAAALAMNGKEVALIFPRKGIGDRTFPSDHARFLNDFYAEHGVEIAAYERVVGMEPSDTRHLLTLQHVRTGAVRKTLVAGVVAGLGITPNVALAQQAGLMADNGMAPNGIEVDASLRTSDPDIYAAGDVANFANPALGVRLRVEHEDNANTMGRMAGRSMAGSAESYDHLPFFYSELFDVRYEAVGQVDALLDVVADWREPHREGVLYYLRDGRVRGVLLWNVCGQVESARRLIAEPGPFRPEDLRGRLPEKSS
jgi:3-phenylpropionate/trans-cinnamate dioxygenase ferredoxin reductase component